MPSAKNPFPGMNPFLEQRWGDVHASLVTYTRDYLQDRLPDDLRARMQERVFIESSLVDPASEQPPSRAFYPDVHVYERPGGLAENISSESSVALIEPLMIPLPEAQITESYIEILDSRSGGRVVTVIEFISRSNKAAGPGRKLYLQKQNDARRAGANLVEIDLLRGGEPVSLVPPEAVPPQYRAAYHACVWRAARPQQVEYYAMALQHRLALVRIPLRSGDVDLQLDLQELVDLCYARGRYDDIDYSSPLHPPLSAEAQQWAAQIVSQIRP